MTLEDFFTLTEMNNGLATPVRVQELVAVMQKVKDDDNRSIADATRQWSAVASAIAATENKDCLELFIQLDGLRFVDSWLQNVQNFVNDSCDNIIEDSIIGLLRAVEKLHVGNEKSVSSGIWASVEKLLGHKSSKVQEMAKALFDRLEKGKDVATVSLAIEKLPSSDDGETGVCVNPEGENTQSSPSCMDVHQSKGGCSEGCNEQDRDNLVPSDKTLDHEIMQDEPSPCVNSPLTKHKNDACNEVETTRFHSEGTSLIEMCSSTGPKHSSLHEQSENPDGDGLKCMQKTRSSEKLDDTNLSPTSKTKDVLDSVTQPGLQGCTDAKENDCIQESSSFNEATAVVSDRKNMMDESGSENHCRDGMDLEATEIAKSDVNLEYTQEVGTSLSKVESIGVKEVDEDISDQSEDDLTTDLPFGQLYMGNKDANTIGKKSDLDLDCGIFDPLELARQVAIEVEREVEQCVKKPAKVHEPNSPDSESTKECGSNDDSNKEELQGGIQEMDSSQVTMAAQDLEANSEKGLCEFDLNQDVCSEDIDQPPRTVAFDKAISIAESDGSSKQTQHGCLDIDLNVAETGDERCTDLNTREHIPLSSALPSGESSVEASSKKLELDLNRMSDEGEAPSDWRMDSRQLSSRQNGPHQSQSPSSSSSSKQPSLRHIDLNDQPGFLNDSSNHPIFTKSPQSVVSIMGMRVEVNQKELLPQSMPFNNGRISDVILDANRTALGMGSLFSYPHSGAYNYNNGITLGPAPPFSPYKIDFRGVPVIPQIVGPASSMPPPFAQQPFIISMSGPPPSNGIMPSRSSFDLNSGMTPEAGNRDLRQVFHPLQPMPMESFLKPDSQPSTSLSIGGKRKEPDGGWESYPFNPHQPPWK